MSVMSYKMQLTSDIDPNYLKLVKLLNRLYTLLSLNDRDLYLNDVEKLLSVDYDINYSMPASYQVLSCDPKFIGCNALHIAVGCNREEKDLILKMILKLGGDFTHKNQNGFTPLRLAFDNLCEYPMPHNTEEDSERDPVIAVLLSAHLEFNNVTNPCCNSGISHLHIACVMNNLGVVKFFLEGGVDVNEAVNSDSKLLPGYTCLHIAVKNENGNMVQLLLTHGADLHRSNAHGFKPLDLFNNKNPSDDIFKSTMPIITNVSLHNERILNVILKLNTDDFDVLDNLGLTQLHMQCIRKKSDSNELEDLKELLENGADVYATVKSHSPVWPGFTPLCFAAYNKNEKVIALLLENGEYLFANNDSICELCRILSTVCEPDELGLIFKTCQTTKNIRLTNGAYLHEVLSKFKTTPELQQYLRITDVNAKVQLDSPVFPGMTMLHLATIFSRHWDTSRFQACLDSGVSPMVQDVKGMTALHFAWHSGNLQCLRVITPAHIDTLVNLVDNTGLSLFHVACLAGKIEIARRFIQNGVSANLAVDINLEKLNENLRNEIFDSKGVKRGLMPLHIAVLVGSPGLARMLLEQGAHPYYPDEDGLSWIHTAFSSRRYNVFANTLFLFEETLKTNPVAPGGLSHFHIACYKHDLEVVKALLPLVTNINEPIGSDIKKYIKLPGIVCVGDTALHLAIFPSQNISEEIVDLLLASGADVNVKNEEGLSPLHVAIDLGAPRAIIRKLLLNLFERKGKSPEGSLSRLHVACFIRDVALIKEYLEDGDDIDGMISGDSPMWRGFTPLNFLPLPNDLDELIELLLAYVIQNDENSIPVDQESQGAEQQQQILHKHSQRIKFDQEGFSVFHLVCTRTNANNVRRLLEFGANVDAPCKYLINTPRPGATPLHCAVMFSSEEIVEILLKHGADISRENSFGVTPIHLAALRFPSKFEVFLRVCEVDILMKNSFGESLLEMIFQNLRANLISSDNVLRLLRHDSINNIDFPTKMRLLKMLAQKFPESTFKSAAERIPVVNDIDENDTNIIHHLAMRPNKLTIPLDVYKKNIELLFESGCDFERQDEQGKTPLHHAVLSEDLNMVQILLSYGANINVTDTHGTTPYMSCYKVKRSYPIEFVPRSLIPQDANLRDIMNIFHKLVSQMHATGLHLHPDDHANAKKFHLFDDHQTLNEMENIYIYRSYSLRAVFSENMVATFSTMAFYHRQAIIEYMDSDDMSQKFRDWLPLYKMQVRRAQKRQQFFQPACRTLQALLDPRLPLYFIQSVLTYLSKQDWENLSSDSSEQ